MSRAPAWFAAVGVAALAVWLATLDGDPHQALLAWTGAYAFFSATVVSALVLVMVLHVTHARWWLVFRRTLMAFVALVPLSIVGFLPLAFGFHRVFPWAAPIPHDVDTHVRAVLEHQRAWNDARLFLVRAAVYLGTWTVLAWRLARADADYERSPSVASVARVRRVSATGLPIVALTLTFASFDWVMSLERGWMSNILGLYVFTSGLVAALGALVVAAWIALRVGALPRGVGGDHFHALGRLLLMSVILWAYIAFFQLLLVWIADLPREVTFYAARARGAFGTIAVVLVVGGLFAPLLALLLRGLKQRPGLLALVAGWLVAVHALDFAWLVLGAGGRVRILDFAPFLALTALGVAYAVRRFQASQPLALAPGLSDALDYRSP